jgi:DNA-binding NarL/FixJ family response regulator
VAPIAQGSAALSTDNDPNRFRITPHRKAAEAGMKVLVISDHKLLGHSLVAMLAHPGVPQNETLAVDLCDSGSAVARLRESRADVVLVEAITNFKDGIATLRTMKNAFPVINAVMLGVADDEASVYESIVAGADGYLTHDAPSSTLVATLLGLKRSELGLSRTAALRVIRRLRHALETGVPHLSSEVCGKLTPRERDVLELMYQGMSSREIAQELGIAEATIFKRVQNIFQKLHVKSRTQAILANERDHEA